MIGIFLRTIIGRLLIILFLIISIPFLIFFLLLPRSWLFRSRFFFWCENFFHSFVLKCSGLPITYQGALPLTTHRAIFVGNHQSSFDIPLAGHLMRKQPHVWLSLAELRKSLLLRLVLPKVSILVDMSSPAKGVRTLREAITLLQENPVQVIIFPEGGRFTDGTVHPFFRGFALIARKTNRPVVPFFIKGIRKVYPPGSFWVRYHPITVTVGEPMAMGAEETEEAFTNRVYQWFLSQGET